MRLCSELENIADGELVSWVQGYWTGANLYLGGSDLCAERANINGIDVLNTRILLKLHCKSIQNYPIMMSAFNALKGLPKIAGSRAASCG